MRIKLGHALGISCSRGLNTNHFDVKLSKKRVSHQLIGAFLTNLSSFRQVAWRSSWRIMRILVFTLARWKKKKVKIRHLVFIDFTADPLEVHFTLVLSFFRPFSLDSFFCYKGRQFKNHTWNELRCKQFTLAWMKHLFGGLWFVFFQVIHLSRTHERLPCVNHVILIKVFLQKYM